jgi:hypothetical protein
LATLGFWVAQAQALPPVLRRTVVMQKNGERY